MSATVQATCPGCKNVLRIPVSWADKALKCKKCGTVVQARKKGTAPADPSVSAPEPTPPARQPQVARPAQPHVVTPSPVYPQALPPQAVPAVAAHPQAAYPPHLYPQAIPAPQADLSSFVESTESAVTRKYRAKKHRPWVGPLIVAFILAGVAGAAFVFKDRFSDLVRPTSETETDKANGVAKGDGAKTTASKFSEVYPRRMMFVSISKYIYFNALSSGKSDTGADLATAAAKSLQFEMHLPTDKANDQLFTLIDTNPRDKNPPLKSVLTSAYEQFFETSREQDHIVLYFGGHAVEQEGKAYLVPVEGEPDDVETLIPLEAIYAKLKDCKAQQKVVIFDVCRFNPGFGAAKPGSEKMTEALEKAFHTAPPGVQVITSCSKGENALESQESGSAFLASIRHLFKESKSLKSAPDEQIPANQWSDAIRAFMASRRDTTSQTPKLTGTPAGDKVAYNKDEPPAKMIEWPAPPKGASHEEVQKLIETANLPGIRKELEIVPAGLAAIFPFPVDQMKKYAPDGITSEQIMKDAEKYPLRMATIHAMETMRKNWTNVGGDNSLRESFEGTADERVKKEILREQEPLAKLSLAMKDAMSELEGVQGELEKEKSLRWKVLYQYALAQAQMRWAYLEEYNLSLGNIRTDNLQKAPAGTDPMWKLASVEKMKSKRDIKDKADASKELMGKIAEDHKGTPWEVLAKMHKNIALGLEWKLVDAKKEKDKAE